MLMDPSPRELAALAEAPAPLQALLDFIGLENVVKDALWEAMGEITQVRDIVFIPLED